jgi:hypothetical protein
VNIRDVAATGAWGPFKPRPVHLAPGADAVGLLLVATPMGRGERPCRRSYNWKVTPPANDHSITVRTGAGAIWPVVCSAGTVIAVSPVHRA